MAKRARHKWSFTRVGGVDQVVFRSGEDIAHLRELDQKLWVALACPTKGTELDEKTLALIDTDQDGRVRAPDVLASVEWMSTVLRSLDLLFERGDALPLEEIDPKGQGGTVVLASAQRILADLGKDDSDEIALEDVLAMEQAFVATRFNGDGIVPADSAAEPATKAAIEQIIGALGSLPDRSGKPGVDQKLVEAFFEQAHALLTWHSAGQAAEVKPLGEATAAAVEALAAVESKLDDYFTRCRIAAFDGRAATALNASDAELQALAPQSLTLDNGDVAKLPLARIEGNRPLPLSAGLNPAWVAAITRFTNDAVTPLLGPRTALSEADYAAITAKLAPFRAWSAELPTGPVGALGVPRVRELVEGGFKAKLDELIEKDASLESEYAQIAAVEKAVRLRRDLLKLLRNFVNFADFYARRGAVFQAGTLYLDGRACDLVVYVNEPAKHATLAGLSKAYLAYCECSRGAEKAHIVAAFTAGDVDNLMSGRNGVFYDRKGRDWDARITNIIENPISIRQAFWSPYKRLVRMIEEQVAKRAAEKERASTAKVDSAATSVASAGQNTPGTTPAQASAAAGGPGQPKRVDVGMVAAVGVAVAGAATFLSSALGMFLGLGLWMPFGLIALVLAISTPSMLIAWLKLRQRNLGPVLDANGWAINGRVRINVPFGGSLTKVARLPEGASRAVRDPYADKSTRWWVWVVLFAFAVLGAAWAVGKLDVYLSESFQSNALLRWLAPGAAPATPPTAP